MQHTIYIRDELVLEARPDGPYILLSRAGEPGKVRYLAHVLYSMVAEMAGSISGDEDD